MIELTMESLIKELQQIKEQQKELSSRESLVKALLKESMEQEGIDKQETDYGTVYQSLCTTNRERILKIIKHQALRYH